MPIRTLKRNRAKIQQQAAKQRKYTEQLYSTLTTGIVVDTNDPQQMGRIKVLCTMYGDSIESPLEDLPWCSYVSPFAGALGYGERGPERDRFLGSTAYGIWSIPKIGAKAIVTCLDGNSDYRVWIGCMHGEYFTHTLPHGRFFYKSGTQTPGQPEGPLSSTERPIQPTYKNFEESHTKNGELDKVTNFEWRTRVVDTQAAALTESRVTQDTSVSRLSDDISLQTKFKKGGGGNFVANQGSSNSRLNPEFRNTSTIANNDPMTYSVTTPGFHSISMDDKAENCRMRFRTTAGNQIILDDTNERIYISTAKGKNWIEMDQQGNVEIFTDGNMSVRAKKNINFTADETIRFYAKDSIHMRTENEYRLHANKDIHVRTEQNYRQRTILDTFFESDQTFNIQALQDIKAKTNATLNLVSIQDMSFQTNAQLNSTSGADTRITASSAMQLLATNNIIATGSQIHLNGPGAAAADPPLDADPADELFAYATTRVPEHEPWGRISTDSTTVDMDNAANTLVNLITELDTPILELDYDNDQVNKKDRDRTFVRGTHWRR